MSEDQPIWFNPSERLNLVFAINYVISKMKSDPKFEFNAPATIERLQSALDKIEFK